VRWTGGAVVGGRRLHPLPVQGHLTTVKVDDSWTVDDFDVAAAVP
jgi:hypothetical protein